MPRAADPVLCAVPALERWRVHRGDRPGAPFLPLVRGGAIQRIRLSDKAVVRAVKAATEAADLDPRAQRNRKVITANARINVVSLSGLGTE